MVAHHLVQAGRTFAAPVACLHISACSVSAGCMLLHAPLVEPLGDKPYACVLLTGDGRSLLGLGVNEHSLEVRYSQRAAADIRAAGWWRTNVFVLKG